MEVEFNPWNVSSLEEFLFYNCPECESKYSVKEQFVGHAMVAHQNARDVLTTILNKKVGASNEHEPTEEVDPERFDDNGNDNNSGIQIAKVESISSVEVATEIIDDDEKESTSNSLEHEEILDISKTEPISIETSGSSSTEVTTGVIDDENESIASDNEELDETWDISNTEAVSDTSSSEPEVCETSTLDPVTIKITKEPTKKAKKVKESNKYKKKCVKDASKCRVCGKIFPTRSELQKHK